MALKENQNTYTAFVKSNRYGKFDNLYGTGDHPSEGGKVVKGVNGNIRIQAGLESDIMKANPEEGEYVLMQRKGYKSFNDVPVDDDGLRSYGWWSDFKKKTGSRLSRGADAGYEDPGAWDTIQASFGWGEYSDDELSQAETDITLTDMLGTSMGNIESGTTNMMSFIDKQYAENLKMFDIEEQGFKAQAQKLDLAETDIQSNMGQSIQANQNAQIRSGMVGTPVTNNIEAEERAGTRAIQNVGMGREELGRQEDMFAIKKDQALTQSEIDKYKVGSDNASAMASLLTSYMSATGEDIPDEFSNLFEEFSAQYT